MRQEKCQIYCSAYVIYCLWQPNISLYLKQEKVQFLSKLYLYYVSSFTKMGIFLHNTNCNNSENYSLDTYQHMKKKSRVILEKFSSVLNSYFKQVIKKSCGLTPPRFCLIPHSVLIFWNRVSRGTYNIKLLRPRGSC